MDDNMIPNHPKIRPPVFNWNMKQHFIPAIEGMCGFKIGGSNIWFGLSFISFGFSSVCWFLSEKETNKLKLID